ncbi:MAG: hypothetical protein ABSE73_27065 [Planctomycetota bacterium]
MKTIAIRIRRFPYEEPHALHLVFYATNGVFEGRLEYYCNANDLNKIGSALQLFPTKVPDEYNYQIGSTKPEDNFAYYFALRPYTFDAAGHCALQVVIDNNGRRPGEGACRFSIQAEPWALNRLGKLLLEFAKLRHHELTWTVSGDGDSLVEREAEGSN